ncbi:hypothetical protein [Bifidobacterium thermophilum]
MPEHTGTGPVGGFDIPPAGPVPLSGGVRRGVDATVDAVLARA